MVRLLVLVTGAVSFVVKIFTEASASVASMACADVGPVPAEPIGQARRMPDQYSSQLIPTHLKQSSWSSINTPTKMPKENSEHTQTQTLITNDPLIVTTYTFTRVCSVSTKWGERSPYFVLMDDPSLSVSSPSLHPSHTLATPIDFSMHLSQSKPK